MNNTRKLKESLRGMLRELPESLPLLVQCWRSSKQSEALLGTFSTASLTEQQAPDRAIEWLIDAGLLEPDSGSTKNSQASSENDRQACLTPAGLRLVEARRGIRTAK
ncbi:MAG: hypothetical protein KY475_19435 [Planctomycetes bacterium]|nr:hypothetical protein [Planctomycetota bacterium]